MDTVTDNKLKKVIELMNELDIQQRELIFNQYSDEWLMALGLTKAKPLSLEEYNEKLQKGIDDYENKRTFSHIEIKNKIAEWKKGKI